MKCHLCLKEIPKGKNLKEYHLMMCDEKSNTGDVLTDGIVDQLRSATKGIGLQQGFLNYTINIELGFDHSVVEKRVNELKEKNIIIETNHGGLAMNDHLEYEYRRKLFKRKLAENIKKEKEEKRKKNTLDHYWNVKTKSPIRKTK